MSNDLNDRAIELMKTHRFAEAIPLFRKAIEQDPSHWGYWYMAGQCYRFLNELENAVTYLKKAIALKSDEPSVLLSLGIALQLTNRLADAVAAFRKAIELDPDYELAYNSLALTQKKQGELELALHNYDAGVKALTRRIVKSMRNDRSNRIFKHRNIEPQLWSEYCIFGAMFLCTLSGKIEGMAWPTGEQAMEEERTERHGGLYWDDCPNSEGKLTRLFLPNYFNTFGEMLRRDRAYSNFIGNRGTVLEQLGRHDEANQHFKEAEYFLPQS
jgi:tetratricopeptide (TPR) repeat protein